MHIPHSKSKPHLTGKFFVFLLLISCLASCSSKKYSGNQLIVINGKIYQKGSTKPFTGREIGKVRGMTIQYDVMNGLKDGEFKVFYSNGNLQMQGRMVNNKNEGLWKYYYNNSQLESEGNFKNDMPDGKWLWYYINGALKEHGFYLSGKRNGQWLVYDGTGNVVKELYFKDGIEVKK